MSRKPSIWAPSSTTSLELEWESRMSDAETVSTTRDSRASHLKFGFKKEDRAAWEEEKKKELHGTLSEMRTIIKFYKKAHGNNVARKEMEHLMAQVWRARQSQMDRMAHESKEQLKRYKEDHRVVGNLKGLLEGGDIEQGIVLLKMNLHAAEAQYEDMKHQRDRLESDLQEQRAKNDKIDSSTKADVMQLQYEAGERKTELEFNQKKLGSKDKEIQDLRALIARHEIKIVDQRLMLEGWVERNKKQEEETEKLQKAASDNQVQVAKLTAERDAHSQARNDSALAIQTDRTHIRQLEVDLGQARLLLSRTPVVPTEELEVQRAKIASLNKQVAGLKRDLTQSQSDKTVAVEWIRDFFVILPHLYLDFDVLQRAVETMNPWWQNRHNKFPIRAGRWIPDLWAGFDAVTPEAMVDFLKSKKESLIVVMDALRPGA